MVLHAGLICDKHETKFITFNAGSFEQSVLSLEAVEPDDLYGVDEIFNSIESSIKDQLGCLCICLENNYSKEMHEKFIQAGKDFGFDKVETADILSADFVSLVSATNAIYKTRIQDGDSIWVFCGQKCRIWRKDEDMIRFVKEYKYMDTVESLIKIKNSVEVSPDMILYDAFYNTSHHILEEMFRHNVRLFSFINSENGVIIKARIMAGDHDVMCYKTESLFDRHCDIEIDENSDLNPLHKDSDSEYTFANTTTDSTQINTVAESAPSTDLNNLAEKYLPPEPNISKNDSEYNNKISIYDDSDLEERTLLTESPILAALARMQPFPNHQSTS